MSDFLIKHSCFSLCCSLLVFIDSFIYKVDPVFQKILIIYTSKGNIVLCTEMRSFAKVIDYDVFEGLKVNELACDYGMIIKEVILTSEGSIQSVGRTVKGDECFIRCLKAAEQ